MPHREGATHSAPHQLSAFGVALMVRFQCKLDGRCCRKYWIPVTHLDLHRLELYCGMRVGKDLLALYEASLYEDLSYPCVVFGNQRYYLALSSKPDGSCLFLLDDGRCRVHPFKPLVCRFYPFVYVDLGGDVDIEVNENAIGECPGLVVDDAGVPPDIKESLKKVARARIKELRLWESAVAEWNATAHSRRDFDEVADVFIDFALSRARREREALEKEGVWVP